MAESHRENKLDQAVDFSLGLLSEAEERDLLAAAREDSELEEIMRRQCASHEHSRAEKAPGEEVPRKNHFRLIPPMTSRSFRVLALGSALAASLALVFLLRPQPGAPVLWLPVDGVMSTQRTDRGSVEELREGVAFYQERDLEGAIASLKKLEVTGAALDLRNLYLASALLNQGQKIAARDVLTQMDRESLPAPWRDHARALWELCGEHRGE